MGDIPVICFEFGPGPEIIKLFIYDSTEHEISTAHKN